jgi:hypothetical protein
LKARRAGQRPAASVAAQEGPDGAAAALEQALESGDLSTVIDVLDDFFVWQMQVRFTVEVRGRI